MWESYIGGTVKLNPSYVCLKDLVQQTLTIVPQREPTVEPWLSNCCLQMFRSRSPGVNWPCIKIQRSVPDSRSLSRKNCSWPQFSKYLRLEWEEPSFTGFLTCTTRAQSNAVYECCPVQKSYQKCCVVVLESWALRLWPSALTVYKAARYLIHIKHKKWGLTPPRPGGPGGPGGPGRPGRPGWPSLPGGPAGPWEKRKHK